MHRPLSVTFTLVLGACSSLWEPGQADEVEDLLAGGRQVFVLGIVENQRQDPVITFDHMCAGVHRQRTERDTIELFPDGTARRAIYIEHLVDGQVEGTSYIPASGTWISSVGTVSPGALLNLWLTPASGGYTMPMGVTGRTTLSRSSAMGGVCNGSIDDSRTAEFVYTKR